MGNKKDKQKQALLEQQQREDRARQQAYMEAAAKPSALETEHERQSLEWLNQTSGKNGPLDINNLTAMKPNLALYDNASRRQSGERMGIGALQMGAQNTNPGLTQLLRSQQDDQRQQDAAGGLENAYRMTDASMRGNIMPLLGLGQNRTMGLAGMASGNANNSTNRYSQFRVQPSFWQNLLMAGVSGASQVGSAFAGRPSDSRLKGNVQPMSEMVKKLKQLNGVSFTWNLKAAALGFIPGSVEGGVLAQQVEQVFPELVTVLADGYRRVNYMALTGMLVEVLKTSERENAELRARL